MTVLLDRFISYGLCESLIKILDGFGHERLNFIEKHPEKRTEEDWYIRDIQINCQCVIIQLCYRTSIINRFESLGGLNYIDKFETMNFTKKKNKWIFVRTVLQYCSENQSIRLTGPAKFFVKILFQILKDHYNGTEDLSIRSRRLCFISIAHLSLNSSTIESIWQPDHLYVFYYHNLKSLREFMIEEDLRGIKRFH